MMDKKQEDLLDDLIDQLMEDEFDLPALRTTPQEGIDELQPHLGVARWLKRQGQKLSPSSSFIRDSWRSMKLRLEHDSKSLSFWSQIRNLWLHSFWRRSFFRRVALPASIVMVFLLILVGPVVVSAARDASPGDRLYPIKLSIEKIQLVFALSEEKEIQLLSEQATERLKEAQRVAETTQIEDLEFALEAYRETTYKYLNKLGLVDRAEISPITDALDQNALEQVHILEALNNSVTNFDTENQDQVRSALDASMEGANAFRDWLTQLNPTEVPPVINTPNPTSDSSDQNRATPTPRQNIATGTPSSWHVTPTPTSNSDISRPTPTTTASSDGSKPPYTTPTANSEQNSLNGGYSITALIPTATDIGPTSTPTPQDSTD